MPLSEFYCVRHLLLYLVKYPYNILIPINHTINLYILFSNFVDNHIIFPYRIFVICPKADPFGKIRPHSRKHLKIFKFSVNFLYCLCSIFFIILSNVIPNIFKSFATIGLIRSFNILFPHKCFQFFQIQPAFSVFYCFFSFLQLQQKLFSARSRS